MPDEKIDQKRPAHAESEPKPVQQRYVDDTVDDSFPASDPPAWTTSGARSVAARCEPDMAADTPAPLDHGLMGGAGHTVQHLAGKASSLARDLYHRGEVRLQEGWEHLPEAGRYYRQGTQAMRRPVQQHPLAAVILAGAVGCALGWLLRSRSASPTSVQWRPGRRPNKAQQWRPTPRARHEQTTPFFARQDAETASHTNNSF